jgi:glycosyltransferase involved in cell wall biosynthesis
MAVAWPIATIKMNESPRLALISSADWESIQAKGVVDIIRDFEEAGFFSAVTTIFPLARRSMRVSLAANQEVVQYGYDAIPGATLHRAIRLALAPLLVLRVAVMVRRLVRAQQISVVRATDPYWCGLLGWLATIGTPTAFCVSLHANWDDRHRLDPTHGAPKLFGSRTLAKWLESFVLRRAWLVLCIRRSLIEYAVRSGAPRARTRLIPHGIDLDLLSISTERAWSRLGLPEKIRLVVFVGRLSRENYVYDMLELARRLSGLPDTRLIMVGGGLEEAALRVAVDADPVLAGVVIMTGFVDRKTAIAFRKAATVNVVPMGGFSLIEACASGRPVVSYDVEWHSELIDNGRNGILIPEGDSEAFADAVCRLCRHPEEADRLGAAGRASAFEQHDIDRVRQHRIDSYRELLAQRGQAA